ncbi:glutamine synthetase [Lentilactobacillus fungorum]|uniref:glutamine synthetase n=1 Tax=Lentilactobacillus fungorum TaxID=2201250 RepID=A0ABQ3VZP6_9LACO|nr:type I glutamate--ammonia ligase [Lentilactobacillus fungorum]GHP13369.1 glutamine synthetase [Lentilactobacillus fungorum]
MKTADDIRKLAKDEDVAYLRMSFSDLNGALKNVEIPIDLLDVALNNQVKIDGSSITGFLPIQNSDMYLYPDLNTWTVYPWITTGGKTASMICDVHNSDGTPFVGDPRFVLKRLDASLSEIGCGHLNVGAEMEYFLFKADEAGKPTNQLNDQASYFDVYPDDRGEACRRETVNTLKAMGFSIVANHHEVAPGQCEIDFKFDNAVKTADRIQLLKLATKTVAVKYGLRATFMPKPKSGVNGSGMHLNTSLFDDSRNLFDDSNAKNGLSELAMHYLAGILAHAQAFTAITNPTINSYKRLVPGYEAPTYVAWAIANRTALVRVPDGRGPQTRFELRSGDPAANPYLAIAAILASGLDGIKNKLTPPKNVEDNIYNMSTEQRSTAQITQLPTSLPKALTNLQADQALFEALGSVTSKYLQVKQTELTRFQLSVTDWEKQTYFNV